MTTYTFGQLETLWDDAGGPKALAPLMAAIAKAESGGESDAENPSGARGPWQILGPPPGMTNAEMFDPKLNAKAAVWKYTHQGLTAWETYTNGAYKKFLPAHFVAPAGLPAAGAAPAGGGGGGWPGDVLGFFTDADHALGTASHVALALFQPSSYVRIVVGGLALVFLAIGLYALYKGAAS